MQMHVDFSFYQTFAFQVLILIPYKQNVAQAYEVRIFFCKGLLRRKKCTSKSFTFLSNFWGALHPWSCNSRSGKKR